MELTRTTKSNRWSHVSSPFVKRKAFGDGSFRPQYLSPMHATPETKWADSFQNLAKSAEGLSTSAKRKIFDDAGEPEAKTATTKAKKEEPKAKQPAKKSGPISKFVIPTDPDAVLAEVS